MRVHAHDYRGADLSGIYDGAILMHHQVLRLLQERTRLAPHDLTAGPRCLADVGTAAGANTGVVYAGSGPYAFLYHLWRERTGADFPIVREVHTALWSGYWLQEELCAPLVRPGDLALFPTEYTRRLYRRHFPSVRRGGSAVAYPMLPDAVRPAPPKRARRTLRVGYLGALSLAKNFDQVLEVFARAHRETGGAVELVCAGKANDPRWEDGAVRRRVAASGADPAAVHMAGMLPQRRLASFFEAVDVLLFPSTASRETLGRVVLEALEHGVPVLAADLGPAVELLPARNLLPAALDTGADFSMGRIVPLGRIDEDAAVARLVERDWRQPRFARTAPYRPGAFLAALEGDADTAGWAADERVADALRIAPRAPNGTRGAAEDAEAVFGEFFTGDRPALLRRVKEAEAETGTELPAARAVVEHPDRNLADYRALPRLLDTLVLPPLAYRLDGTAPAPHTTTGEATADG